MAYQDLIYPQETNAFYQTLKEQVALYTWAAPDLFAALANATAVLMTALPDINWVGFYWVRDKQLVLGPFQGKPAVMTIDFGQGVCGAAWKTGEVQVVDDVHCFDGHIACDRSSGSELVIPLKNNAGQVLAVLDIDSTKPGRFSSQDAVGLSQALTGLLPTDRQSSEVIHQS